MTRHFNNFWSWSKNFGNIAKKLYSYLITFLAIVFFIVFLDNKNIFYLIFSIVILFFLFIFRLWREIIIFIIFIFISCIWIFIVFKPLFSSQDIEGEIYINQIKNNLIIFEYKNFKVGFLSNFKYEINDLIYVKAKIKSINNSNLPIGYIRYLKSINIFYILEDVKKFDLIQSNFHLNNVIKNYLLDSPEYYLKIIPLLLIGYKNKESLEVFTLGQNLSIIHLFVISGFHIGIIKILINFLTWKMKKIFNEIVFILLVIFYLFILNFPISTIRAFLFITLNSINKYFLNNRFSKIKILLFIAFIFLAFNPYIFYSLSFIFTFVITFFILLSLEIKNQNKIYHKILTIFIINLASLPLILFLNNQYNLMTIFNTLIFSPIISCFYIFSILFFWWKDWMNFLSWIIYELFLFLSDFQFFIKNIYIEIEIIYLYYIILLICILFMVMKTTLSIVV